MKNLRAVVPWVMFLGFTLGCVRVPQSSGPVQPSMPQSSPIEPTLQGTEIAQPRFRLGSFPDMVTALAYSPDGKFVAAAAENSIRLWDAERGGDKATLQRDRLLFGGVTALVFTSDAKTLIVGGSSGLVQFWDIASGTRQKQFRIKEGPLVMALSPDGKTLAVGTDGQDGVCLVELATGAQRTIPVDEASGKFTSVKFIGWLPSDHRLLAVVSSSDGLTFNTGTQRVVVWELSSGKEKLSVECAASYAALSADGKCFAIAHDQEIQLRNTATGKASAHLPLRRWQPENPLEYTRFDVLALNPAGTLLAAATVDSHNTVQLTTLAGRKEAYFKNPRQVGQLAFSPDGATLATGEAHLLGSEVKLWDLAAWSK